MDVRFCENAGTISREALVRNEDLDHQERALQSAHGYHALFS